MVTLKFTMLTLAFQRAPDNGAGRAHLIGDDSRCEALNEQVRRLFIHSPKINKKYWYELRHSSCSF